MPDFNDLSLEDAIKTLKGLDEGSIDPASINLEDDTDPIDEQSDPTPDDDQVDETDDQVDDPKPDDEQKEDEDKVEDPKPEDKKVQTPEENRKFAEQRRQQELERRVQEELSKRLAETPEVAAMKRLQELGFDPNTIIEQATLARLQEQSQQTGIPLEILQQQHQIEQQSNAQAQQIAELQWQLWESKMQNEASQVQQKYSALTDDDMSQAIDYMVNTLQRTDIPLEQAVMAVHGEKIMQSLRDQARNEVLAEKAGRKAPLTPQGGKAPSAPTLTPEEKQIAKLMGIKEEDYLKYK